jgi:hypothetical protein
MGYCAFSKLIFGTGSHFMLIFRNPRALVKFKNKGSYLGHKERFFSNKYYSIFYINFFCNC